MDEEKLDSVSKEGEWARFCKTIVRVGRCMDDTFPLLAQIERLLERKPIMGAVLRGEASSFLHRDRRSALHIVVVLYGMVYF